MKEWGIYMDCKTSQFVERHCFYSQQMIWKTTISFLYLCSWGQMNGNWNTISHCNNIPLRTLGYWDILECIFGGGSCCLPAKHFGLVGVGDVKTCCNLKLLSVPLELLFGRFALYNRLKNILTRCRSVPVAAKKYISVSLFVDGQIKIETNMYLQFPFAPWQMNSATI